MSQIALMLGNEIRGISEEGMLLASTALFSLSGLFASLLVMATMSEPSQAYMYAALLA